MTCEDKTTRMATLLDEDVDTQLLSAYLQRAKSLILNKRFPYGFKEDQEVEPRFEDLQIELAIVLFNEKGAEGQSAHSENGVARTWRTKDQILEEITPYAGVL